MSGMIEGNKSISIAIVSSKGNKGIFRHIGDQSSFWWWIGDANSKKLLIIKGIIVSFEVGQVLFRCRAGHNGMVKHVKT